MDSRPLVVDATISGQLIGLLAVLASALAVALSRHAAVTTERAADCTKCESNVDVGKRVVDTLRLLLRPTRSQNHRMRRASQQPRGFDDRCLRHTGDLRDSPRPVDCCETTHLVESLCAITDVRVI